MKERTVKRWLGIARDLLNCPTAPLMEELTARHVWDFAGQRRTLFRRQDASGNILMGYPGSGKKALAPLVVVAHLDHPAFHVTKVEGKKVCLGFRGGVRAEHVQKGLGVRFHAQGNGELIGRGMLTRITAQNGRLLEAEATVRSGRAVVPGFATWDVPTFRVRGKTIEACACDDVLGCAALLCVLDELHRSRPRDAALWVLFTRAEELGFFGALRAAQARVLPRRARVISLECSRALANAPQGEGVILRIGDAASVFDPGLCAVLRHAAEDLKRAGRGFRYQRRLMDGGTCEALPFGQAGYRATGLALPLGNYHNQAGLDGGRKTMGAESVHADDFSGAVQLVLHLACANQRRWQQWERATGKRLAKLARQAKREIGKHPLKFGS
jgi:endoglucanase